MNLPENNVVVAIDECYSDNNGAWIDVISFDTVKKTLGNLGGIYSSCWVGRYTVNASKEEIAEAAEVYAASGLIGSKYVGCIVELKRSKKAPNGVPLKIMDYDKGGYDGRYGCKNPERIAVDVDGIRVWVGKSCIEKVIKGSYPWWKNK